MTVRTSVRLLGRLAASGSVVSAESRGLIKVICAAHRLIFSTATLISSAAMILRSVNVAFSDAKL